MLFNVPSEYKEFWGAEFLTPKGKLAVSCAVMRIETYVRVNGLLCEDGHTFKLDDTLKAVLNTDRLRATYSDIQDLLSPMAVSI